MIKRLICFVLCLMLYTLPAMAETPQESLFDPEGEFEYALLEEGGIIILGWHGGQSEVTVPAVIDGQEVKAVGRMAFSNAANLTAVRIPEGRRKSGKWPFTIATPCAASVCPKA